MKYFPHRTSRPEIAFEESDSADDAVTGNSMLNNGNISDQSKAQMCNNLIDYLNMPHLSRGWFILAKEKWPLSQLLINLICIKYIC